MWVYNQCEGGDGGIEWNAGYRKLKILQKLAHFWVSFLVLFYDVFGKEGAKLEWKILMNQSR